MALNFKNYKSHKAHEVNKNHLTKNSKTCKDANRPKIRTHQSPTLKPPILYSNMAINYQEISQATISKLYLFTV
jgi:hypothetical protein